jgi:N12 class adenine-specific DNA methylase/predicted RNA methylase
MSSVQYAFLITVLDSPVDGKDWVINLLANKEGVLEGNDEELLNVGFIKQVNGAYSLPVSELEGGRLDIPTDAANLLDESPLGAINTPIPWVSAPELGITLRGNVPKGGVRPTTVVATGSPLSLEALLNNGFKQANNGVIYLSHPENRAFASHKEMFEELLIVTKRTAISLGLESRKVAAALITPEEHLNPSVGGSRSAVFEMPWFSGLAQEKKTSNVIKENFLTQMLALTANDPENRSNPVIKLSDGREVVVSEVGGAVIGIRIIESNGTRLSFEFNKTGGTIEGDTHIKGLSSPLIFTGDDAKSRWSETLQGLEAAIEEGYELVSEGQLENTFTQNPSIQEREILIGGGEYQKVVVEATEDNDPIVESENVFNEDVVNATKGIVIDRYSGASLEKGQIDRSQWHLRFNNPAQGTGASEGVESIVAAMIPDLDSTDFSTHDTARKEIKKRFQANYGIGGMGVSGTFIKSIEISAGILSNPNGLATLALLKKTLDANLGNLTIDEMVGEFKSTMNSLKGMESGLRDTKTIEKQKSSEAKIAVEETYLKSIKILENVQELATGDWERHTRNARESGAQTSPFDFNNVFNAIISNTVLEITMLVETTEYLDRQESLGHYPFPKDVVDKLKEDYLANKVASDNQIKVVEKPVELERSKELSFDQENEDGSMVSQYKGSLGGIPASNGEDSSGQGEAGEQATGYISGPGGSGSSAENDQGVRFGNGEDEIASVDSILGFEPEVLISAGGTVGPGMGGSGKNALLEFDASNLPSVLSMEVEAASDTPFSQADFFDRVSTMKDDPLKLGCAWVGKNQLDVLFDEDRNELVFKAEDKIFLGLNLRNEAVFLDDDNQRHRTAFTGLLVPQNPEIMDVGFVVTRPVNLAIIDKTDIASLSDHIKKPIIIDESIVSESHKILASQFSKDPDEIRYLAADIARAFKDGGDSPLYVAIKSPIDNTISRHHLFSKIKEPLLLTPEKHNALNEGEIADQIINENVILNSNIVDFVPVNDSLISKIYPEYLGREGSKLTERGSDFISSTGIYGGSEHQLPRAFVSQMNIINESFPEPLSKVWIEKVPNLFSQGPTVLSEVSFDELGKLTNLKGYSIGADGSKAMSTDINFPAEYSGTLTATGIDNYISTISSAVSEGKANISINGDEYYEFDGVGVGREIRRPEPSAPIELVRPLVHWSGNIDNIDSIVLALDTSKEGDELSLESGEVVEIAGVAGMLSIKIMRDGESRSASYHEIFGAENADRLIANKSWVSTDWSWEKRDQPSLSLTSVIKPELTNFVKAFPLLGFDNRNIIDPGTYATGSFNSLPAIKQISTVGELYTNFKNDFPNTGDVAKEFLTNIALGDAVAYSALEHRIVSLAGGIVGLAPTDFVVLYPNNVTKDLPNLLVRDLLFTQFAKYSQTDGAEISDGFVRYDEGKLAYLRSGEVRDIVDGRLVSMTPVEFLESDPVDRVTLDASLLPGIIPLDSDFEKVVSIENIASLNPKVEAEAEVKTESETEVEAKVETKFQTEVEAKVETKVQTEVKAKVETKVHTEVEAEVQTKVEAEVQTKVEAKVESIGSFEVEGEIARFEANVSAIKLIKNMESRGVAHASDMTGRRTLRKFSGWGSLSKAFPRPNGEVAEGWKARATELASLLTDNEYTSAKSSTLDGFYTKEIIVKEIYNGIDRIGLKEGGRLLEPAMGSGNFINGMPGKLRSTSEIIGVELDDLTGRIARGALGTDNITVHAGKGFQDYNAIRGSFDAVITNAPFGDYRIYDAAWPDITAAVHEYFPLKAEKMLRQGGLNVSVVSSYLMDKKGDSTRKKLAEKSELLGAIRLPNNAFKSNAGTEVVSDIIFLKNYEDGEGLQRDENGNYIYPKWVKSADSELESDTEKKFFINQYFIDNPENVLGKLTVVSGQFGPKVTVTPPLDFNGDLAAAMQRLPENVYIQSDSVLKNERIAENAEIKGPPKGKNINYISIGGMFNIDGKTFVREMDQDFDFYGTEVVSRRGSTGKEIKLTKLDAQRVYGQVEIKEILDELLTIESGKMGNESDMDSLRASLNKRYDAFTAKHGRLNRSSNTRLIRQDPSYVRLVALETRYQPAKKANLKKGIAASPETCEKADVFSKRVSGLGIDMTEEATTPAEALVLSLCNKGKVDLPYIESLLPDLSYEKIMEDLTGDIFVNPETDGYEWSAIYLSGNVKKKLAAAEKAAFKDERYGSNVEYLMNVVPADIPLAKTGVTFGANWITADVYEQFISDTSSSSDSETQTGFYNKVGGRWEFEVEGDQVKRKFSTLKVSARRILESAANGNLIKVTQYDPKGDSIVDTKATAEAAQKVVNVKEEFAAWILKSQAISDKVHRLYNDTINTDSRIDIRAPKNYYPPNLPPRHIFELRPNQLDYVFRSLLQDNIAAIHFTGAGKTAAETVATFEQIRVGQVTKSLLIAPNALVKQWANLVSELYPHAKIMAPGPNDFKKENREEFFAKVAMNQVDMTIIAHSQVPFLPVDHDVMLEIAREEVSDMRDVVSDALSSAAGDRTVKQMEARIKKEEVKIKEMVAEQSKGSITTKDCGIDKVSVDEYHLAGKNLPHNSKLNVLGLGPSAGSKKCTSLLWMVRAIQKNEGKVAMLTATPISNTIVELHAFLKYLNPVGLKDKGLYNVDAFLAAFAKTETRLELRISGEGYKLSTLLTEFKNIPELLDMYLDVAHTVSEKEVTHAIMEAGGKPILPKLRGGKTHIIVLPKTPAQEEMVEEITDNLDILDSETYVDPRKMNKLLCGTHAKMAALHPRALDEDCEELMVGKLKEGVDHFLREIKLAQDANGEPGLHLGFCDIGVPKEAMGRERERVNQLMEALEGDEGGVEAAQLELDKYSPTELQSILAGSRFCFQESLREALLMNGLREDQVASMHDAKSPEERQALFDRCNNGEIVVLFGTTSNLGTGANVARNLIGMVHFDAPPRPSDFLQRLGRGIRTDNKYHKKDTSFTVYNVCIATEGLDEKPFSRLETKSEAFKQITFGEYKGREADDIGSPEVDFGELKAMTSGDMNTKDLWEKKKESGDVRTTIRLQTNAVSEYRRSINNHEKNITLFSKLDKHTNQLKDIYAEGAPATETVDVVEKGKSKTRKAMNVLIVKSGKTYLDSMSGGAALLNTFRMAAAQSRTHEDTLAAVVNGVEVYTSTSTMVRKGEIDVTMKAGEFELTIGLNDFSVSPKTYGQRFDNMLGATMSKGVNYQGLIASNKKGLAEMRSNPEPVIDPSLNDKLKTLEAEEVVILEKITAQESRPVSLESVIDSLNKVTDKYSIFTKNDEFRPFIEDSIAQFEEIKEAVENNDAPTFIDFKAIKVDIFRELSSKKIELGLSKKAIFLAELDSKLGVSNATDMSIEEVSDAINEAVAQFEWLRSNSNGEVFLAIAENLLRENLVMDELSVVSSELVDKEVGDFTKKVELAIQFDEELERAAPINEKSAVSAIMIPDPVIGEDLFSPKVDDDSPSPTFN